MAEVSLRSLVATEGMVGEIPSEVHSTILARMVKSLEMDIASNRSNSSCDSGFNDVAFEENSGSSEVADTSSGNGEGTEEQANSEDSGRPTSAFACLRVSLTVQRAMMINKARLSDYLKWREVKDAPIWELLPERRAWLFQKWATERTWDFQAMERDYLGFTLFRRVEAKKLGQVSSHSSILCHSGNVTIRAPVKGDRKMMGNILKLIRHIGARCCDPNRPKPVLGHLMAAKTIPEWLNDNKDKQWETKAIRYILPGMCYLPFYSQVIEYLRFQPFFSAAEVNEFLIMLINNERINSKRKIYTNGFNQASVDRWLSSTVLTREVFDTYKNKKFPGTPNSIVNGWMRYLNGESVQHKTHFFTTRLFHIGESSRDSHDPLFYVHVVHLMELQPSSQTLVVPCSIPASHDNSGAHLFLLVVDMEQRTITSVCINNELYENEGFILAEAITSFLARSKGCGAWRYIGISPVELIGPMQSSICAEVCLYIATSLSYGLGFPTQVSTLDLSAFRSQMIACLENTGRFGVEL